MAKKQAEDKPATKRASRSKAKQPEKESQAEAEATELAPEEPKKPEVRAICESCGEVVWSHWLNHCKALPSVKHKLSHFVDLNTGETAANVKAAMALGWITNPRASSYAATQQDQLEDDAPVEFGQRALDRSVRVSFLQSQVYLDYEWLDAFQQVLVFQELGVLQPMFRGDTPEDFAKFAKWVLRHFKATTAQALPWGAVNEAAAQYVFEHMVGGVESVDDTDSSEVYDDEAEVV